MEWTNFASFSFTLLIKNIYNMRKIQLFASLALATLLTACGGKSTNSVVDDAISAAEQEVQIVDNAVLGKLPSLYRQMEAAKVKVDDFYKAEMSKAEKREDLSRLGDERKAAIGEVYTKYFEQLDAEAKKLDGKEVKIAFDEEQISAATAKLHYQEGEIVADVEKDSYKRGNPLRLEAELTLAAKLSMQYGAPMWNFNYLDAEGNEVEGLAGSFDRNDPRCATPAGEKITLEVESTPWIKEKGQVVDHVWVGFLK